MPNAHRFALAALPVIGSAVLAALAVTTSTPRYAGARVPPVAQLPWPAAVSAASRQLPFVLLYVDSRCVHCGRAAVFVDSVARARQLRAVIVTSDSTGAAEQYRSHLGLHRPLLRDSSAALIHALGTRSVPTLVIFHSDGSRQLIVGFTRDEVYRRALDGVGP